ncbi:hypothetical protein M6B38_244625 [Iris pallida]|uniref:Uncharacterized protein n=1 Tax=Iris pallida TaxID=29817 RepID=A0AAX6DI28_IRIPA|nr:hypothetical protein M6B38_244625 [Iris pallida]
MSTVQFLHLQYTPHNTILQASSKSQISFIHPISISTYYSLPKTNAKRTIEEGEQRFKREADRSLPRDLVGGAKAR